MDRINLENHKQCLYSISKTLFSLDRKMCTWHNSLLFVLCVMRHMAILRSTEDFSPNSQADRKEVWLSLATILGQKFHAHWAVHLLFGLLPLKKLHALQPQWPWCPTCTGPALHCHYFALSSISVCCGDSDFLLVKLCRNCERWANFYHWINQWESRNVWPWLATKFWMCIFELWTHRACTKF